MEGTAEATLGRFQANVVRQHGRRQFLATGDVAGFVTAGEVGVETGIEGGVQG